jgi:hypothetical protein
MLLKEKGCRKSITGLARFIFLSLVKKRLRLETNPTSFAVKLRPGTLDLAVFSGRRIVLTLFFQPP